MGENNITDALGADEMRTFVKAVLEDVHALERMLDEGRIEHGVRRIGAEQELFLVDRQYAPRNAVLPILERLKGQPFTTELAQFNLEANLPPLELRGDCLSRMEAELDRLIDLARRAAAEEQTRVVMCGILPTLEKSDLGLESMTPIPRYHQLNRKMTELRGGTFSSNIKGLDEFQVTHDNVMLEACNTSFQVHYQVGPAEFAKLYNLAQAITAPLLAIAVNSPFLLQHRLWHETRVALFQQSLDTRSSAKAHRGQRQRVSFGEHWVRESIMEIFREDVARFRSLIAAASGESPLAQLDRGEIPPLSALRLHNGTVYRWNRPCYGVADGVAHLRIENRVMPAGPSVPDEVANAGFYFGLMTALAEEYGDISREMSFDDAKANFVAAARYGLHARFRWRHGKDYGAQELVLDHLLPLARQGLEARELEQADIDRYLGIVEQRVRAGRTGAQWGFDSLSAMGREGKPAERYRAITAAIAANQESGLPVHQWPLARLEALAQPENYRTVEQIMTTDVFTVHPEDLVDLAASLMEWEHVRSVPVEDAQGALVGLVSLRSMLRLLARSKREGAPAIAVRDIMTKDPITIAPEASTLSAIQLMRSQQIGSLPVVRDGKLVGIVTEHDIVELAGRLLEGWLSSESGEAGARPAVTQRSKR